MFNVWQERNKLTNYLFVFKIINNAQQLFFLFMLQIIFAAKKTFPMR